MRDIIHRYKYSKHPELGKKIASLMQKDFDEIVWENNIDVVMPVPLHKKRYKERGYNQAQIIVKNLCKKNPSQKTLLNWKG
jgi:predicted amidophosphoribosyltransferase